MWMMGCSSDCCSSKFNFNFNRSESDSINSRKLRPLIPKPTTNTTFSAMPNPSSYCTCLHKTNLFSLNDHMATMKEQSKADSNTTVALVSARWNPTPDQLRALEEMYEGGIRTPSADQIQQIAAKLRQYGKIEGKNVFYWFQNHKARERQKRRRILDSLSQGKLCDITTLQRKEPGLSKTGFEVAHAKNKATSSNSSTLSEESISIHRAVGSESRSDGQWIQFEEKELQHQRSSTQTKPATWQQLMKPSSSPPLIHFINTTTTTTDPEDQTLQLFPIRSNDHNAFNVEKNVTEVPMIGTIDTSFTPNEFFEFLPVKK
ncbi:hypothetical protein CsSME_00022577 [Camellia sinensis var. sinensis]